MEVILICLAIAVAAAFIVTGVMKAQLKSVRWQNTAGSYIVPGSFCLTHSRDLYLYKNVTRHARPQNKK